MTADLTSSLPHHGFFAEVQSDDAKVLIISVAARMAGMHPQTLRQYDRMGLVQPGRASGGGRRYSARDVALLREIQHLSQDDGVNLAGVKRIIELEQLAYELQQRLADAEAATPMIAEGVRTTASAIRLAREVAVPMPICEEVGAVLFHGKPVAQALEALLARDPRPEEEAGVLA